MRCCEWCGVEFEATQPEQAYCKTLHAKKASQKRRKEKLLLEQAGKCPTPFKRVWIDDPNATNWKLPTSQYLYHCKCGAIHAATNKTRTKATAA